MTRRQRLREILSRAHTIQLDWSGMIMLLSITGFWAGYFLSTLIQHLSAR